MEKLDTLASLKGKEGSKQGLVQLKHPGFRICDREKSTKSKDTSETGRKCNASPIRTAKEDRAKMINKISLDIPDLSHTIYLLDDDKFVRSFPFSLSARLEQIKALKGLSVRHYDLTTETKEIKENIEILSSRKVLSISCMQNDALKAISRESECGPLPLKSRFTKRFSSSSNPSLEKNTLFKERNSMPVPRELSTTKMNSFFSVGAMRETKNSVRFKFDLELNRVKPNKNHQPAAVKE